MKASYWHFKNFAWTKIFEAKDLVGVLKQYILDGRSLHKLEDIDSTMQELSKEFVMCDLAGGARYIRNHAVDHLLELPLDILDINMKDRCYTGVVIEPIPENDQANFQAQVIVLEATTNMTYIVASCTSYGFWEMDSSVHKFIASRFNTINLEGWLLRIGQFDIIDKKFKTILR